MSNLVRVLTFRRLRRSECDSIVPRLFKDIHNLWIGGNKFKNENDMVWLKTKAIEIHPDVVQTNNIKKGVLVSGGAVVVTFTLVIFCLFMGSKGEGSGKRPEGPDANPKKKLRRSAGARIYIDDEAKVSKPRAKKKKNDDTEKEKVTETNDDAMVSNSKSKKGKIKNEETPVIDSKKGKPSTDGS